MKLEGKQLGSWKLVSKLGSGGNAQVWRARDSNRRLAALKILTTRRATSSQYKRFKTEVEFLQRIGDKEGLLPILDASLPDVLTDENPAWFAMPIAKLIRDQLGDRPVLETVVAAIRDIARVLAELATEGTSHRDIKPENLYRYKGEWAVGDFGLVSFPSKEAITEKGQQIGPRHFVAPEMLTDPEAAAGPPADVYSLMKTFWVLATGQAFPPPGQQRIEIPAHTLSAYVDHKRAKLLDRLLENATADDPRSRPPMSEVEIELTAWLDPTVVSAASRDLSDLSNRISALADPRRRLLGQRQRLLKDHEDFLRSMMHRLNPISDKVAKTLGVGQLGFRQHTQILDALDMFRARSGKSPSPVRKLPSLTRAGVFFSAEIPGNDHASLMSGIGTTLYEDGIIGLDAGHFVRMTAPREELCPPTMIWSMGVGLELVWSAYEETRLGSAHMENVAGAIVDGLTENLRAALERFTELLESWG